MILWSFDPRMIALRGPRGIQGHQIETEAAGASTIQTISMGYRGRIIIVPDIVRRRLFRETARKTQRVNGLFHTLTSYIFLSPITEHFDWY